MKITSCRNDYNIVIFTLKFPKNVIGFHLGWGGKKMINSKKAQRTFCGGDKLSKVSVLGGVLLNFGGGLGRVQRKVGRLDGDRISLRVSQFLQIKWIYSPNSKSVMEVPGSLVKHWKMKKSETMWCSLRRILPKVIAD